MPHFVAKTPLDTDILGYENMKYSKITLFDNTSLFQKKPLI